jgi:hypothetical protein
MRKLDHEVTERVDDRKQARACGQHSVSWVFWTPIREEVGNRFRVEIECEKLCKLLYEKRAGGDCDTLK